jgi:hypothetical protein
VCARFRREVKEITPDEDHQGYTIKARHWEPRHYLDAMKDVEASKAQVAVQKQDSHARTELMIGVSAGLGLGAVIVKKGLPLAQTLLPEHAALLESLLQTPLVVYAACVVIGAVVVFLMQSLLRGGKAPAAAAAQGKSCHDIPPVGDNGKMVTVEQMAKGGSGGAEVMQGITVDIETIRAKYVVNAAGCYSVGTRSAVSRVGHLCEVGGSVVR